MCWCWATGHVVLCALPGPAACATTGMPLLAVLLCTVLAASCVVAMWYICGSGFCVRRRGRGCRRAARPDVPQPRVSVGPCLQSGSRASTFWLGPAGSDVKAALRGRPCCCSKTSAILLGPLAEGLQAGAGYAYWACPLLALQRLRGLWRCQLLSCICMCVAAVVCGAFFVCVWSLQVSALLVVYWMCSL